MDLDALKIAVSVLGKGSFAAVARDRGVEPSSISRTVQAVESELGFRLFQRTTRRLAPTDAGAAYLARAADLIADLEEAADEAAAATLAPTGKLRLTSSVAFGTRRILPLLPEFRSLYPAVSLDLLFTDENLDLVAERVDLAIRLAPSVTGDVICSKLMETRYRVVATPGYWSRAGLLAKPDDLNGHRCLLFSLPAYRSRWLFRDGAGRRQAIDVGGDLVFTNALALFEAARLGMGPALLPDWLTAEGLASGELVDPLPRHHAAATTFDTAAWLLYPSRAYLPAKVRVAVAFLRERIPATSEAARITPPAPSP
jgi:DNA-binding transcriptional LysR family regulator